MSRLEWRSPIPAPVSRRANGAAVQARVRSASEMRRPPFKLCAGRADALKSGATMNVMDRQPNHEDALLILRVFELRRDARMREARDWFARYFNATTLERYEKLCPPGSEENTFVRMVTSYWDMVASFLTNGVLHEELFFQSGRDLLL